MNGTGLSPVDQLVPLLLLSVCLIGRGRRLLAHDSFIDEPIIEIKSRKAQWCAASTDYSLCKFKLIDFTLAMNGSLSASALRSALELQQQMRIPVMTSVSNKFS